MLHLKSEIGLIAGDGVVNNVQGATDAEIDALDCSPISGPEFEVSLAQIWS